MAYRTNVTNTECIATKERFVLNDSVNASKDEIVVNILPVDEKQSSFIKKEDINQTGKVNNYDKVYCFIIKCIAFTLQQSINKSMQEIHTIVKIRTQLNCLNMC